MEINEEFARYILALQSIAIGERGTAEQDALYQRDIFEAFPNIKEEAEWKEFTDWLWSEEVERDPRVENLRSTMRQNGRIKDQNKFENLLRELDTLKNSVFFELRDNRREEMLRKFKVTKAVQKMTKEE